MRKTKKLVVEFAFAPWQDDKNYRVAKTTDTVEFSPGDLMSKAEVKSLCDKAGWNVTIIPVK